MITRRTLLTGSAAALAAPTASPDDPAPSPAASPVPAPGRRPGPRRTGRTRTSFTVYTGLDEKWDDRYLRGLDVLILPRDQWDARAEDMVEHGWNAQYIDDGRQVLAVKLGVPRWVRRRRDGEAPDGESLAILRRLRGSVLRALEAEPDVTNLSMTDGGNGWVALSADLEGIEPTGHIRVEFSDQDLSW